MRHLERTHTLVALVVFGACLAAGASVGVAYVAGFDQLFRRALDLQWEWLGAALAGEALAYLGYTFAYRDVARTEGGTELPLRRAAALVSAGFGVFVAAGGFALDESALQRLGLSKDEARARVLALGVLEYLVLAPVAVVAAVSVLLRHPSVPLSFTIPWVTAVPGGILAAWLLYRYGRGLAGRRGFRSVVRHTLAAFDLMAAMARAPVRHVGALAGIAVYWAGDIFCLWAALHLFQVHPPPVSQLVLGYATGYALTRRTLPLGGAGIVEVLLPVSLGWVGIPLVPAFLASLVYRGVNLWLPLLPALVGLPTLRRLGPRRPRRPRRPGAASTPSR